MATTGHIEQTFEYNGDPMFYMALVEGTFSKLKTSGSLEAAGKTRKAAKRFRRDGLPTT